MYQVIVTDYFGDTKEILEYDSLASAMSTAAEYHALNMEAVFDDTDMAIRSDASVTINEVKAILYLAYGEANL